MTQAPIKCSNCNALLPVGIFNTGQVEKCGHCGVSVRAELFPALFTPQSDKSPLGEKLVLEDQAGCFFHPQNKAIIACSVCGRFICSLCDVEFDNRHICPSCLNAGLNKGNLKKLETNRVLYDDIALSLAILPLLFFWLTFITAPIALFLALRHWKKQTSIIPRTKLRFIAATILAGLQITGWLLIIANLMA